MKHARAFVGLDNGQSAMICERGGATPCTGCKQKRVLSFTALVPVVRGHSRPRTIGERHPQATVCYRCVLVVMLKTLFARSSK